jgi:hypothetical protein
MREEWPDIRGVPTDLETPPMEAGEPAPGKRVRMTAAEYAGTEVYHALYLPADWERGRRYPVLVEYAGNGLYSDDNGDLCTGRVEDCNLGSGISGGEGFIWLCLPYVSEDGRRNQRQWWGDVGRTLEYCRETVRGVCGELGGDPGAVVLAGFSRGAIACNYLGLRDEETAGLWRAFVVHSHYDGVREWEHEDGDRDSARERLKRLRGRPQFISHEGATEETEGYLEEAGIEGDFTFCALPYRNHTDSWVLRNIPERKQLRQWLREVLEG